MSADSFSEEPSPETTPVPTSVAATISAESYNASESEEGKAKALDATHEERANAPAKATVFLLIAPTRFMTAPFHSLKIGQ